MSRVGANWSKTTAAEDRALGSIWLQGIGRVKAKQASQFVPGDLIAWNYGSTSRVVAVTPLPSGRKDRIDTTSEGKPYSRDYNLDRMLAIG
jgi:hypothetical protein